MGQGLSDGEVKTFVTKDAEVACRDIHNLEAYAVAEIGTAPILR